jgi:hypothetical protein
MRNNSMRYLAACLSFVLLSACGPNEAQQKELAQLKTQLTQAEAKADSLQALLKKHGIGVSITGMYHRQGGGGLYNRFEIKGSQTIVVYDGILGLPHAATYTRDGNLINIHSQPSNLILRVQDENTLVGEGYAQGVYVKGK